MTCVVAVVTLHCCVVDRLTKQEHGCNIGTVTGTIRVTAAVVYADDDRQCLSSHLLASLCKVQYDCEWHFW